MADQFINELNTTTTIQIDDMLVAETNPGGTPETKGILWDDLQDAIMDFQSYKIVPSVTSNNLTVAIKDLAGNDATVHKVIKFKIGDSIYSLAASASITKNAGTNWCNAGSAELAAKPIDFFVYAIAETGAAAGLKFGFSRIPYALTMNDFVNTTTNEKYIAGNWTNFATTYNVVNIGRFRAQLSAAASHNWSIAAQNVVNRPIYETDELSYTATVTSTGGTPTTVTSSVKYTLMGRKMHIDITVNVTTVGTATGGMNVTYPFTPGASSTFAAVENAATGYCGTARIIAGTIRAYKYDATTLWINGYQVFISGLCSV